MKKILLCEDEDVMITAIEFRLQKIGCQTIKARSCPDAMQLLELDKPDLIIISYTIPDGGGPRLLQYVRDTCAPGLPVIVLSTLEQEMEVLEAMQSGANDFTTKPFKPTELVLRVLIQLDKSTAS
jgi:DNA-binding response OmpR family regulator